MARSRRRSVFQRDQRQADVERRGLVHRASESELRRQDSFTYQVDDTAATNNLSNIVTVTLTVTAVNDAPVNTAPATATTAEDSALAFTGADAISVADVDSGANPLTVLLTVNNGTLTATGSGASVSGSGTNSLTINGSVAPVNTALAALVFNPNLNFNGAAMLNIQASDNGNNGAGGELLDNDTVVITGTAVNDPPVAVADAFTTAEGTLLTVPAPGVLGNDTDVDGPARRRRNWSPTRRMACWRWRPTVRSPTRRT